jgi:hypothetical protein
MKRRSACLLAACFLLADCGGSSRSATKHPSDHAKAQHVVVLDQSGRGYAATSLYQIDPQKPWGVAYAFRCGKHAGDFAGDVWEVVNAVELPYTVFSGHGTSGRGLRMETGSTSTINAPNGTSAGRVLGLRIKTACAWHVRVVKGGQAVVRRFVPGNA